METSSTHKQPISFQISNVPIPMANMVSYFAIVLFEKTELHTPKLTSNKVYCHAGKQEYEANQQESKNSLNMLLYLKQHVEV